MLTKPIFTLRLFSDARLSFGSQFYGFCNGAFIIPLPRGCICVMEENSYAANGVKHCVRPCDMTGKSSAVILRQMHHQVVVTHILCRTKLAVLTSSLISLPGCLVYPTTRTVSPLLSRRGGKLNTVWRLEGLPNDNMFIKSIVQSHPVVFLFLNHSNFLVALGNEAL